MGIRNGVLPVIFLISIIVSLSTVEWQQSQARSEQILDSNNNNLQLSMEVPDDWNSGIVSQTISKLNWRLNGLTATNDEISAFFAVANLPSLANMILPLGEKSGVLSLIIGHYVTINGESEITLSDGSKAHRYSITATTEQLHNLNAPIDKGFDAVLITTKQQDVTYIILYASQFGRMGEFENLFQNILQSVSLGSVTFSGANPTSQSQNNQMIAPSKNVAPPVNMTNTTMGGNMTVTTEDKIPINYTNSKVSIIPSCGSPKGFKLTVNAVGFRPDSSGFRGVYHTQLRFCSCCWMVQSKYQWCIQ